MSDDERLILGHIGKPAVAEPLPTPVLHLFAGRGQTPPANVRPCPHLPNHHVTLDEEWETVTCSGCGERLSAFAVLLVYARNFEHHRTMYTLTKRATNQMALASMRRVRRLRGVSDDEGSALDAAIRKAERGFFGIDGEIDPQEYLDLARRVERAIRERKYARTTSTKVSP